MSTINYMRSIINSPIYETFSISAVLAHIRSIAIAVLLFIVLMNTTGSTCGSKKLIAMSRKK